MDKSSDRVIDVVVLDYSQSCVDIRKVAQSYLDSAFGGDIEKFITDFLGYKLDNISWMSGDIAVFDFRGAKK